MIIYKILHSSQWRAAEAVGVFTGAPIDLADGYIHFSTGTQVAETLAKHFAGQVDLLLVSVESDSLGEALRWEVSRGGELFPHLYASLPVSLVAAVHEIPVDVDGRHVLEGIV